MKSTLFSLLVFSAIFSAVFSFTSKAQAEILTCIFTEPFFSLSYDSESKVLRNKGFDSDSPTGVSDKVVAYNVEVKKLSPIERGLMMDFSRYALVAQGKTVVSLTLSYVGSDGMSDVRYPYDAEFNGLWGGCYTTVLEKLERQQKGSSGLLKAPWRSPRTHQRGVDSVNDDENFVF